MKTTLVDTSDPEAVRAAICPNTKLIYIEAPANPTIGVSNIAAIAVVAHEKRLFRNDFIRSERRCGCA